MAILPLCFDPNPVLNTPTKPVASVTPEIRQLVRDMIQTMYVAGGVGLAANQVGRSLQLFVASPDQERGKELVILNPVILHRRGRLRIEEGCLSLPGIAHPVSRAAEIKLRGMTLEGRLQTWTGTDLLARIFQHETDHLHGKLYVDRLPWLTRQRLLRTYRRQRQELNRYADTR